MSQCYKRELQVVNIKTVKQELQLDSVLPCRTCLSVGRRLYPLAEFTNIFKILTSEFMYSVNVPLDTVQLCWECIAMLKKVLQFQMRVRKANEFLHLNECPTNTCLSTLRSQTLHDAQTTFHETKIQIDIDKDNTKINKDELHDSDEIQDSLQTVDMYNGDTSIKKEKYNNRWAKKRAMQNKRPKFKLIPAGDSVFRKVGATVNEICSWLEREKDSEYYKSIRYRCQQCGIAFSDEDSLLKHKGEYHNALGEYACDICKEKFTFKRHLSKHMVNHYDMYECTLCGLVCRDVVIQKGIHLRKHRKVLQCLKCELKFCNRRDFFKHYKEWHEKFICDHCGISFKMRYCIKDHIRKQHSPFQCGPCNKTFGRYNGLWLHNKLRHTPRAQPAYCVECDKHYADVYRYRWHLANSAKHKPRQRVRVACPSCDKVFSKKIYMKDHYDLVHLKNFKYRCEECDKNFIRNADLVKHRRRVHEGVLPPKDKICYVCGKGFTTNKILTNHMRTHTGERPYECGACPARFSQRSALASHLRSVHRKLRDYR